MSNVTPVKKTCLFLTKQQPNVNISPPQFPKGAGICARLPSTMLGFGLARAYAGLVHSVSVTMSSYLHLASCVWKKLYIFFEVQEMGQKDCKTRLVFSF